MPDARRVLLYQSARSHNKWTVNIIQPARLAHWKCWIDTTTHWCGLMPTQMDFLIQQSEAAGEGSTSALTMAKHFQGRQLQLRRTFCCAWNCQTSQRGYTTPVSHCLPYKLQICCPKPTVIQRAAGKRYTAPPLWPATIQQGLCSADPCSL